MKELYVSYGIESFIKGKNLKEKDIYQWLIANFKESLIFNNKQDITNASDIIEKHWNKFHTWVNEGLIKGTIKGNKISLSNGSAEESKRITAIFNSVSDDIKSLYNHIRGYDKFPRLGELFHQFHIKNNTIRLYKRIYSDNFNRLPLIKAYEQDFQQIIDENLQEVFKEFITNKYKK